MTAHRPITPDLDAIAARVRPFVGAKAFPQRDPSCRYGGYLPQRQAIDLHTPGVRYSNADVREVSDRGVTVFVYRGCDFIPWANIRSITIRGLDAKGNTTASLEIEGWATQRPFQPREKVA